MGGAVQAGNALDADLRGAGTLDLGAHRVQALGKVDDLGLAGGVDDDRLALGQGRRHHQVLGGADGGLGKADLGPLQPARRPGPDVAARHLDHGAEPLEAGQVQVDRPGADGAAAGQRHLRLALAGEQRPQHEDGGAHPPDDVVGRLAVEHGRAVEDEPAGAAGQVPRLGAQHLKEAPHRAHVGDVGHVAKLQGLRREEGGGHQGQGGVLRAADLDGAVEGHAPLDDQPVHAASFPAAKRPLYAVSRSRFNRGVHKSRRPCQRRRSDQNPLTCQISCAYSRIVRSDENQPMRAVLRIAMSHQRFSSRNAASTLRWAVQ